MVWYSHLLKNFPQFVVIQTVKAFGIVNEAEIHVFLELSCFFNDAEDVSNSIFGSSVSSVAQSRPTLYDPMDYSTPGLPVHHQLPEFTQTHAHSVSDAIQPSHPLLSPSPPPFNLSQHQGLFY